MKIKILFAFLLSIRILSAQVGQEQDLNCPFYYDTVLQKKVYETVELYPVFGGRNTYKFELLIMEEFSKISKNFSPQNEIYKSRVIVCFVVNTEGTLENIHICKKNEQEYSTLEKLMVKAVEQLKNEKWEPGQCGNEAVPVLISIPISIKFKLDESDCFSYYDTVLHREIYKTVNIAGKEIKDYSTIDKEVLNIVKDVSCKNGIWGYAIKKSVNARIYSSKYKIQLNQNKT